MSHFEHSNLKENMFLHQPVPVTAIVIIPISNIFSAHDMYVINDNQNIYVPFQQGEKFHHIKH